ncbi:MAG: DUF4870 domain-containing protein [archaeon]
MPAKKRGSKKPVKKAKKEDDTKLFAFLATFLSILGFIIALLAKKNDKYVMFYAKQSLVVFIAWIIASIVRFIPVIGWLLTLFVFVLWIFSWVYSLSGKMQNTPIIGQFANKINL